MRIVISGSKDWTDQQRVQRVMETIHSTVSEDVLLITSGKEQGAEQFAEDLGRRYGWTVEQHTALPGQAPKTNEYASMVSDGAKTCVLFRKGNDPEVNNLKRIAEDAGVPVSEFVEK